MRLIDADALREVHCDGCGIETKDDCKTDPLCVTLLWLDDAPTIDAVPVVRCGSCKWYEPCTDWGFDEATGRRDHSKIVKKPYGECHGQNFHFTEDGCLRVGDDDYCSYGERREENAEIE